MLTDDGRAAVLHALEQAGAGGRVQITDGQSTSTLAITETAVEGTRVGFTITAGEDEANFEWRTQRLVDAQGTVLDEETNDLGRKAPGSVWSFTYVVDFEA